MKEDKKTYKKLTMFNTPVTYMSVIYHNLIPQVIMITYRDALSLTLSVDIDTFYDVEEVLIPWFFQELLELCTSTIEGSNSKASKDEVEAKEKLAVLKKFVALNYAKYYGSDIVDSDDEGDVAADSKNTLNENDPLIKGLISKVKAA